MAARRAVWEPPSVYWEPGGPLLSPWLPVWTRWTAAVTLAASVDQVDRNGGWEVWRFGESSVVVPYGWKVAWLLSRHFLQAPSVLVNCMVWKVITIVITIIVCHAAGPAPETVCEGPTTKKKNRYCRCHHRRCINEKACGPWVVV